MIVTAVLGGQSAGADRSGTSTTSPSFEDPIQVEGVRFICRNSNTPGPVDPSDLVGPPTPTGFDRFAFGIGRQT
jgi:hypothetical protein